MASGTHLSLFLPGGQFRMGTVLLLHAGFGLLLGLGTNVIWWMRTGDAAPMVSVYSFLFASYHAITAFTMHMAVLRAGRERGKHLLRMATGLLACMLLFIVVRWIGDQWLMPVIGEKANYSAQVTFLSFALDNILYALLPIGFATLIYLVEQQLVQHQQRTELAYRERLSELDMLRARMAPHFLYNTLNNLYALSQRSGTDLGPPLMDLADLMRYIAKHQEEYVAIGTELEQVDRLVALQALRYERPLNIVLDVNDALRTTRIPAMVLLPLMENAFKHGDPCDTEIPLQLQLSSSGSRIHITCANRIGKQSGDGTAPTGNHNLRRRLQLLYGEQASIAFNTDHDQRYTVEVSFPISA